MILVGVVYLMNRSIKYLKNKVNELESKMIDDKGDNLRAIKNVENDVITNGNKNNNLEFQKKIKNLEEQYKKLHQKSITDNNNLLHKINEFVEYSKNNINSNQENRQLKNNDDIKAKEQYDLTDSDSEVEEMSDNIAIYSNDNEEHHFSNSDLEELSLGNNSNTNKCSENTDSMIPNTVDNKILDEAKKSTENFNEEISNKSDNLSNNKLEESVDNMTDLLKLKLNRLQCMAEEVGIDVNNIKGKKKTKKELAEEILTRKEKNTTKEQSSSV